MRAEVTAVLIPFNHELLMHELLCSLKDTWLLSLRKLIIYNGAEFSPFLRPLQLNEPSHHLARPLQETVRDHTRVCKPRCLWKPRKQESKFGGNKLCWMECPLCSVALARRLSKPVQETSPCRHHSAMLMPPLATEAYLAVGKKKVYMYSCCSNFRTQITNF